MTEHERLFRLWLGGGVCVVSLSLSEPPDGGDSTSELWLGCTAGQERK